MTPRHPLAADSQASGLAPVHSIRHDLRDWVVVAWALWWSWAYVQAHLPIASRRSWAGRDISGDPKGLRGITFAGRYPGAPRDR